MRFAAIVAVISGCFVPITASERLTFPTARLIASEVTAMARGHTGGTIIINSRWSPNDDRFLQTLSADAERIDQPLMKGRILRMFDTARTGHDGAVIIDIMTDGRPRMRSARNYLPFSGEKMSRAIRSHGLRHGSAAYASTLTDALIVVISQERGTVSLFQRGQYMLDVSAEDLMNFFLKF